MSQVLKPKDKSAFAVKVVPGGHTARMFDAYAIEEPGASRSTARTCPDKECAIFVQAGSQLNQVNVLRIIDVGLFVVEFEYSNEGVRFAILGINKVT